MSDRSDPEYGRVMSDTGLATAAPKTCLYGCPLVDNLVEHAVPEVRKLAGPR
jgi:hypothetical protein